MAKMLFRLPEAARVIENPGEEELKQLTAKMPEARPTKYGNLNVQTKVLARSNPSTFVVSDDPESGLARTMSREEAEEWERPGEMGQPNHWLISPPPPAARFDAAFNSDFAAFATEGGAAVRAGEPSGGGAVSRSRRMGTGRPGRGRDGSGGRGWCRGAGATRPSGS